MGPSDSELEDLDAIGLLDHLPAMVALWDAELRNEFANQAYVEWFGVTPEQVANMTLKELLGPKLYALNRPYIEGALSGEKQLFERVLIDAAGRTRQVQASYTPHIVNGVTQGFFVLVVDISDRVKAERSLLESTEQVVLLRERERIATAVNQRVIRQLNEAARELNAALQPICGGTLAGVNIAIEIIDSAVADLRSAISPRGSTDTRR